MSANPVKATAQNAKKRQQAIVCAGFCSDFSAAAGGSHWGDDASEKARLIVLDRTEIGRLTVLRNKTDIPDSVPAKIGSKTPKATSEHQTMSADTINKANNMRCIGVFSAQCSDAQKEIHAPQARQSSSAGRAMRGFSDAGKTAISSENGTKAIACAPTAEKKPAAAVRRSIARAAGGKIQIAAKA